MKNRYAALPGSLLFLVCAVSCADKVLGQAHAFREIDPVVPPKVMAVTPEGQRLHLLADGKIYLSGAFVEVNGDSHAGLVRLLADGSTDPTFDVAADVDPSIWQSAAWDVGDDGRVYYASTENGDYLNVIRRLEMDGNVDANYRLEAELAEDDADGSAYIDAVTKAPNGSMLISGRFSKLSGVESKNVALLRPDGSIDTNFVYGAPGELYRALPVSGDRWLIIAWVSNEDGYAFPRAVLRIVADGSLDPTFAAFDLPFLLYTIGTEQFSVDSEDRLVFNIQGGMGRMKANGVLDESFAPNLPESQPRRDGIFPFVVR